MAENDVYMVFTGRIQFDPETKDVNGKSVRDFSVKTTTMHPKKAGEQLRVRCTLWPDHADVKVSKGDFVHVEGKFTKFTKDTDDGQVTYYNLSVSEIAVVAPAPKAAREKVNASSGDAGGDDDVF